MTTDARLERRQVREFRLARLERNRRWRSLARRTIAHPLTLLTLALSWYPFELNPPWPVINGAEFRAQGVRFGSPGRLRIESATWFADVVERGAPATIDLEFTPAETDGSHCILAIVSEDDASEQLVVDTWGGGVSIETLTGWSYGSPIRFRHALAPAVGTRLSISLSRHDDTESYLWMSATCFRADGVPGGFDDELESLCAFEPGRAWHVILGNDEFGDRPFLGELRAAEVHVGGERIDLLDQSVARRSAWYWRVPPSLQPERRRPSSSRLDGDVEVRTLQAIWMAILVRVIGRGLAGRSMLRAFAAGAAIALLAELGQCVFEYRVPALADLLAAVIGCAVGALLLRLRLR